MPEQIDSREYREVAKFVENTSLKALATYSEISFTPVTGDLQYFPQPTPEARAAERGFGFLREQIDEIVAILHALAAAADNKLPVPPVMRVLVSPYIAAFRNREKQPESGDKNESTGEKGPNQRRKK